MEIKATRKIENSIMSTVLTIENFGSANFSAEDEMEILDDYNLTLDTGKTIFARFIKIDNHGAPVITDASNEPNDQIVLTMPIESYKINKDMQIKYAVDIDKLNIDFNQFNCINDKMCLGKSILLVFENVVIDWITENFEISKQHHNEFESEAIYHIV